MSTRLSKDFLSYRHTDCVVRYSKDAEVSMEEAERVFVETMKFLYASSQIRGCCPPSREVDNMWHTFLMFSADYLAFCALYAGRYLYHLPIENPDIAHRGDIEKLVRAEFGDLDSRYWAHLLGKDSTNIRDGAPGNLPGGVLERPSGRSLSSGPRRITRGLVLLFNYDK